MQARIQNLAFAVPGAMQALQALAVCLDFHARGVMRTSETDERQLSGLVLWIAIVNVWNRLNVATRQVAGEWAKSADGQKRLQEA